MSLLTTADQHHLHYACFGDPANPPLLFLHGGPGSACNPADAHLFRLEKNYLIQIDQRGCGQSSPLGELKHNTTAHLLADLELLRITLGIETWRVYGGSWGAALALEYAKQHQERVDSLILRGTFLARAADLAWFFHPSGVATHIPEAYARLCACLLDYQVEYALLPQLYQQIMQTDLGLAYQTALAITNWNSAVLGFPPMSEETDTTTRHKRIGRERIFLHYCQYQFFLTDQGVLAAIESLQDMPITLIHGRNDRVCPLAGAELLCSYLPQVKLIAVDAGHLLQETAIREALQGVV